MILVDACVLFDHLRGKDLRLAGYFRSLPCAVCGITRAEVLHGARHPADRAALVRWLNCFAQVLVPDSTWDCVGDNLAKLRTSGITVPFPDVVLASVAIEGAHEVWSRDAHFPVMRRVLTALRLFPEPP
ncbi:MAG TPA: PIN domain-containing protein [Tepidisphaeraceae bacterium]|nr:PIN domain-containing protein [Tepidisphaeraceae bacterium]